MTNPFITKRDIVAKHYDGFGRELKPHQVKAREERTGIYETPDANLTHMYLAVKQQGAVAKMYDEKGHEVVDEQAHKVILPSEEIAEKQIEELINKEYTWKEKVLLFFNKLAFWKPKINGIK